MSSSPHHHNLNKSHSHNQQQSQIPELSLDILKQQNGFQKKKKSSYYGTTYQKIEVSKEQLYINSIKTPTSMRNKQLIAHKSSDSVGSSFSTQYNHNNNNNNSGFMNNSSYNHNYNYSNFASQQNSPRKQQQNQLLDVSSPQDNSGKSQGKNHLKKNDFNFQELIKQCSNIPNNIHSENEKNDNAFNQNKNNNNEDDEGDCNASNASNASSSGENDEFSFFKKNELNIREIIQTISYELSTHHSELKQYLTAYGMSGEIFTFYLNRFLELSCGKYGLNSLFFKINDIIYYKTISLLSNNPKFIPILARLEANKYMILPKTLLEQICTKDLLKQIIQKISEEAKNSTYMSEYFTSDKSINAESAIQIIEDAFAGNYFELQAIVNSLFGKSKFTHVFFYFFKNSVANVLKKQGIPKILIQKILEKIESFRYLLVENHECIEFKVDVEKAVLTTLQSNTLIEKIPRLALLNEQQQEKLSKTFVKSLIFQPEIQILRKHIKALLNEGDLQIILIDQICLSMSQCLQKKDIVEETIHELSIRKEKLLLSLNLTNYLIQDINDIKELVDMIKKGVKKEKHMMDDQKILENPIMIQSYLESLNSPYNCHNIKDWVGSVQLGQVTSWQIGVWFRILKSSLAKLKFNHHTQFLLEQDINYISNYQ